MARNWIKWFRFPSTFLFLLSNKLSKSGPASEWIGWMLLLDTLFPNEVSECVDLHNNLIRLCPLSPLLLLLFFYLKLFKLIKNASLLHHTFSLPLFGYFFIGFLFDLLLPRLLLLLSIVTLKWTSAAAVSTSTSI